MAEQVMMALDAMLVAHAAIAPNPYQPRTEFETAGMARLKASIADKGLLQRLVVRPAGPRAGKGIAYELIAGERRWRALGELGWAEVPVDVREVDDRDMALLALHENGQRAGISPMEQARAFRRDIDELQLTQQEIAEAVGMTQPQVSQILGLLDFPAPIRELIERGLMYWSHARDYLTPWNEQEPAVRDRFFGAIERELIAGSERLSGPEFRTLVERLDRELFPPAPAAAPAPEPRWPEMASGAEKLANEGAAAYAERTGLSFLSAGIQGFKSGVIAYVEGREIHAQPSDAKGMHEGREQGFGWAAQKHGEAGDDASAAAPSARPDQVADSEPAAPEPAAAAPTAASGPPAATPARATPAAPAATRTPPAAAPARPATPAAPAAPAPAAAPVTTLPPPGTGRHPIPDGAGIVAAVLAATGGRGCSMGITPIPGGNVVVTIAPQILKAGERAFALNLPGAEIDTALIPAIDKHFS